VFREGLVAALGAFSGMEVVGAYSNTADLLAAVAREPPDLVILDGGMANGIKLIEIVSRRLPQLPVLAIGITESDHDVLTCLEAGAAGYISREASMEELVEAALAVVRGEPHCPPRIVATLLRRLAALSADARAEAGVRLTDRERQII